MGRKKSPGLHKRWGVWQIDKQMYGQRICESTGTDNLEEAEKFLAHKIEQIRKQLLYGDRRSITFEEAALRFVKEKQTQGKSSLAEDISRIKRLHPFIGKMTLDQIHMGTLEEFVTAMKKEGLKHATINHGLKVVRQMLRLAACEWRDENGNSFLQAAPRIKLLRLHDARKPRPLQWHELNALYDVLPSHLRLMAKFAANTGCRESEVCLLRWEWEYEVPELETNVFLIPAWIADENNTLKGMVKNRQDRLVVLNKEAMAVIEACRGQHPERVFSYRGKPVNRMNNSAWRRARKRAGMPDLRVHDLKHTFGMALRAADVSEEDRKDLLGHKSGSITTHYSAANIKNLIDAANKVCSSVEKKNILTLRRKAIKVASFRESPEGLLTQAI